MILAGHSTLLPLPPVRSAEPRMGGEVPSAGHAVRPKPGRSVRVLPAAYALPLQAFPDSTSPMPAGGQD